MKKGKPDDLSNLSMLELFQVEAENQAAILTSGLLAMEARGASTPAELEALMRAAHSLKGAARIVNLQSAVRIAHAMEDCFVAAQREAVLFRRPQIDVLLRGVDALLQISKRADPELRTWEHEHGAELDGLLKSLMAVISEREPTLTAAPPAEPSTQPLLQSGEQPGTPTPESGTSGRSKGWVATPSPPSEAPEPAASLDQPSWPTETKSGEPPSISEARRTGGPPAEAAQRLRASAGRKPESPERVLRLAAENLDRLLGLAGETLVESRWLRPFSDAMQRLKRMQSDLERALRGMKNRPESLVLGPESGLRTSDSRPSGAEAGWTELLRQAGEMRRFLEERLEELDGFDRRSAQLSSRLYLEVLRTRMRPFGEGVRRFPRLVRDLARSLGKQVRLEMVGEETPVDRDILDRLETPLGHLLRNAVDHGCEGPEERLRRGKPAEAVIRLEARHSAGMLQVVVSDDGAGVEVEELRQAVVERQLTQLLLQRTGNDTLTGGPTAPGGDSELAGARAGAEAMVGQMQVGELLEFLFLPGFTMREAVTEISGRGVGLDVVQNMVRSVRGSVRVRRGVERLETRPSTLNPQLSTALPGLTFTLQLPLTLSVLRALLVEVGGEPYAIPLAQMARTVRLPCPSPESLVLGAPAAQRAGRTSDSGAGFRGRTPDLGGEPQDCRLVQGLGGRWHFSLGDGATPGAAAQIGLVSAQAVLEVASGGALLPHESAQSPAHRFSDSPLPFAPLGPSSAAGGGPIHSSARHGSAAPVPSASDLAVVVLGGRGARYGLVVDRFLGERELVVQPLDERLGKLPDISAAALMADGSPVLIVDVEDLVRSIERHLATGPSPLAPGPSPLAARKKRILAVDDSLTVRELERKLLQSRGYLADVAVDGMEGWHAVRSGVYDLVITDVDMPRLDGIALAQLIKRDAQLKSLPVMIVSYKDREEDRLRGLAAGADYYLTKGSFHDETLLQAVVDLIGEPEG